MCGLLLFETLWGLIRVYWQKAEYKFYTLHKNLSRISPSNSECSPRASYPTTANALPHTCSKEWYLMLSLMNPPTRQTPKTTIPINITPIQREPHNLKHN